MNQKIVVLKPKFRAVWNAITIYRFRFNRLWNFGFNTIIFWSIKQGHYSSNKTLFDGSKKGAVKIEISCRLKRYYYILLPVESWGICQLSSGSSIDIKKPPREFSSAVSVTQQFLREIILRSISQTNPLSGFVREITLPLSAGLSYSGKLLGIVSHQ